MAPSNRKENLDAANVKEEMFSSVKFNARVPDSFVSLKSVERDYGLSLQVCLVAYSKDFFPAFYGQRSVAAAWTPVSVILSFCCWSLAWKLHFCLSGFEKFWAAFWWEWQCDQGFEKRKRVYFLFPWFFGYFEVLNIRVFQKIHFSFICKCKPSGAVYGQY